MILARYIMFLMLAIISNWPAMHLQLINSSSKNGVIDWTYIKDLNKGK
jgi:hypothetical protein